MRNDAKPRRGPVEAAGAEAAQIQHWTFNLQGQHDNAQPKALSRHAGPPFVGVAGGTDMIQKGDTIGIDFEKGVVIHEGREYHFPALPKEVLAILNDGGLIPHVKKLLGKA